MQTVDSYVALCPNDAEPQNQLGKMTFLNVALLLLMAGPGSVLLLASIKWIHFRYLLVFSGNANLVSHL